MDDDAESIIINERYNYITDRAMKNSKKKHAGKLTVSDKIDMIATNRILALPFFALVMFLVYTLSIGTVGEWTTDFMNNGLFGSFKDLDPSFFGYSVLQHIPSIPELLDRVLIGADGTPVIAGWLYSLIMDGIVGGVGSVLGFVPQMLVLFFMLSILEDCGYMSRVAFIMDRIFRRFGLSGKSFIPILVASGCGVPGIMASRTIENERDRRITIMTTGFIPCGAKMPIVGLISASLFGRKAWVAVAAYFIGIAAVIISGIILKKFKSLASEPSPFVMELPAYHAPLASNVFRTTWDRAHSYAINPNAKYYPCSRILRTPFYEEKWSLEKAERHSIYVGNGYNALKGAHFVVMALPYLVREYPDVKVYIAGYKPYQENDKRSILKKGYAAYLKKLIYDLGVQDYIEFTGPLKAPQVAEKLSTVNTYVLCSTVENSPNTLGEAMMVGTPCVAAYVGGVSDMAEDGKEALFYRNDDPKLLAWNIKRIFDSDELALSLSEAGKKKARITHDPERNAQLLIDAYTDILKEK